MEFSEDSLLSLPMELEHKLLMDPGKSEFGLIVVVELKITRIHNKSGTFCPSPPIILYLFIRQASFQAYLAMFFVQMTGNRVICVGLLEIVHICHIHTCAYKQPIINYYGRRCHSYYLWIPLVFAKAHCCVRSYFAQVQCQPTHSTFGKR